MAITVTALIAALGAYTREDTQEVFLRQLYNPVERRPGSPIDWTDIVRRNTFLDEQAFARAEFNVQVQEQKSAVTEQSAAAITMDGAIRKLRRMEHIHSFNPFDLYNSWLAMMTDRALTRKFRSTPDIADTEFVPWLYDRLIAEFMSNFYLQTSFAGNYTANFAYADSWPAAADGFLTIVADLITATTISPVITGAITDANAYDKLEQMGKTLPASRMNKEQFLLCSYGVHDSYNYDFSQTFPGQHPGLHPEYQLKRLRDRPNVVIVPCVEMGTSQRVIITGRDNLEVNMDLKSQSGPQLTFHPKDVKSIQYMLHMAGGFSIAVPKDITVNDQA